MRGSGAQARRGLSRAISVVTAVVVLVIVAGILLVVLEANPDNDLVSLINDVADALVGPFENLFTLDERKTEVAVNWGIAAVVYLVVGRILAAIAAP
jgi:hypothetical protein